MMLKSNLIIVLFLFFVAGVQAQTTVTGKITGLKASELVFNYALADSSKSDTVLVKNGSFVWNAKMDAPQKVYIFFPNRYVEFFAEKGKIQISGNADALDKLKITGSKTQDEATAFEKSLEDIYSKERALNHKYGKVSKEEQLSLEQELTKFRMQRRAIANQYIEEHPASAFSVSLVDDRAAMGEYEDVKKAFDLLASSAQQSSMGKRIAERLLVLKRSSIGEQILNFTQNNTEGQPVSYSDFKGKYVFIDFWASWCGPCRAENPNVLKAYNEFKDRNFTVLGVSLDEDGDSWRKAIKDDAMPWTQVSDLKGWMNEVSNHYGIRAIPSTLLIDPQGRIIAKDLRGEMLHKKLSEILN